jgi:hypothetical protein
MQAVLTGAVITAIERSVCFQSVADDLAATICTPRCQDMDGALETIKRVRLTVYVYFETIFVFVATHITLVFTPVTLEKIGE